MEREMCVWYPLSKCSRSTALRRIPAVCSRLKPRENFREGKFPLNWLSATMHRCNDFTNTFSRMPYCGAISKSYWVYCLVCLLWSTRREICHLGYCSKLLLFAIQRALVVRVFKCELCHTGRSNSDPSSPIACQCDPWHCAVRHVTVFDRCHSSRTNGVKLWLLFMGH